MLAVLIMNLLTCSGMLFITLYLMTTNWFQPASIPTIFFAAVGAAAALAGIAAQRARSTALAVSAIVLMTLWIPAMGALFFWPGGDDGGALGWTFIVGAGCLASFFVGLLSISIGPAPRTMSSRKSSPPRPSSPQPPPPPSDSN